MYPFHQSDSFHEISGQKLKHHCDSCKNNFELFSAIKDYVANPKCIICRNKNTFRRYIDDIATQNCSIKKSDSELKTIGDIANRNRDRLSNDEKQNLHEKHNSYKQTPIDKPLPKGMSRIKKSK